MNTSLGQTSDKFREITGNIAEIGLNWHESTLVNNAKNNKPNIRHTIRDLKPTEGKKSESAIVISAGPSLYKNKILERILSAGYGGTIIAVDGSFIRCLKGQIDVDYVLTLDPHPTRIVRWFGDPQFEKNSEGDNYYSRQDLDVSFRNDSVKENAKNIELVNKLASGKNLIICSSAPKNVVARCDEAGMKLHWWAPLVDDPKHPDSITRKLVNITGLPAMNTGGTVGTAAWVFAQTVLRIPSIAVVGMELGYYKEDTSYYQTQTYYALKELVGIDDLESFFPECTFPLTGEAFYTDPTYFWYRQNMLDLLKASGTTVYNCTGGGTLVGEGVKCVELEEFIAAHSKTS